MALDPQHKTSAADDRHEAVLAWLRQHAGLSESAEASAQRAVVGFVEPLPLALNRIGVVGDRELQEAMIAVSGYPAASSAIDLDHAADIAQAFLKARRILPLEGEREDEILLGMVDPFDQEAIRGVLFATGLPVRPVVLRASEQKRLFAVAFDAGTEGWNAEVEAADATRMEAALEFDRDAPVARKVAGWLAAAVARGASDVHIEPRSHALVIRFRIDGLLQTIAEEPLAAAPSVVARIKVLAELDLGDRRSAQDGRTTIVVAGRPVDVRASVVPSVHGEAVVLRILDRASVRLTLDDLGFAKHHADYLAGVLRHQSGLFLVTGPTGSGKTTTLYAMLELLKGSDRKILSIEDPVEFYFDHVTQVQYAPKAGVTFPSAIRSFLRQDPDVILVGEIRDGDTARSAIQAALTGHLVLASLHAIDAPRALPRLLDMGVEPYQVSACLKGVVAQRLVRRVCPHCRSFAPLSEREARLLSLPMGTEAASEKGCSYCDNTGFTGRTVIAEALDCSPQLLEAIRENAPLESLLPDVMPARLIDDAGQKCVAGITTPSEALAAVSG